MLLGVGKFKLQEMLSESIKILKFPASGPRLAHIYFNISPAPKRPLALFLALAPLHLTRLVSFRGRCRRGNGVTSCYARRSMRTIRRRWRSTPTSRTGRRAPPPPTSSACRSSRTCRSTPSRAASRTRSSSSARKRVR